jgi:hypothetical protein
MINVCYITCSISVKSAGNFTWVDERGSWDNKRHRSHTRDSCRELWNSLKSRASLSAMFLRFCTIQLTL